MTLPTRRRDTERGRSAGLPGLDSLTQELVRLFDERWPDLAGLTAGAMSAPIADVEETDEAYVIDVEMPGLKKDEIDIELQDQHLVITGERKEPDRVGLMRRKGRTFGRIYFEITLPETVDEEHVEARLEDGVLHVRVPKREGARRRHIDIR
jgi:HSP20 family protein